MPDRKTSVLWAVNAVRDLDELIEFIPQDSVVNAASVLKRIRLRTADLGLDPMQGRVVPELAVHGMTTWRELVIKPYRIIYRADGGTVIVIALLDSRRNLNDILLRRLIRP